MYLTKNEVANVLRVSVRTITTYMQQRVIPAPKKIGRTLLWDEEELHRWVKYSTPSVVEQQPSIVKRGRPRKVRFD